MCVYTYVRMQLYTCSIAILAKGHSVIFEPTTTHFSAKVSGFVGAHRPELPGLVLVVLRAGPFDYLLLD